MNSELQQHSFHPLCWFLSDTVIMFWIFFYFNIFLFSHLQPIHVSLWTKKIYTETQKKKFTPMLWRLFFTALVFIFVLMILRIQCIKFTAAVIFDIFADLRSLFIFGLYARAWCTWSKLKSICFVIHIKVIVCWDFYYYIVFQNIEIYLQLSQKRFIHLVFFNSTLISNKITDITTILILLQTFLYLSIYLLIYLFIFCV